MAKKVKKVARSYIAKAPIRRLMKNEGAKLVAEDCITFLIEKTTKYANDLTKKAVKICKEDKRKRVTAADINAAAN